MSENLYDQEKRFTQPSTADDNPVAVSESDDSVGTTTKPRKKRYIPLEIAIWTWILGIIAYLLIIVFSSSFDMWAGLIFAYFGFIAMMVGFAVASVWAVVDIIRRRSWVPSLIALVISFPVILVFKMFGL